MALKERQIHQPHMLTYAGLEPMEDPGVNEVVFPSDLPSEASAFVGKKSTSDWRGNVAEARAQYDRIVMDTEVLRSLHRRLGELCDELSACCRTVISAADTCDSVSFLMTLDMTFRFFLRSRGMLYGTPEGILRNMASTLKGCCDDLEDLANAMNKLDLLIAECEAENRSQCLALNHGEGTE